MPYGLISTMDTKIIRYTVVNNTVQLEVQYHLSMGTSIFDSVHGWYIHIR